MSDAQNSAESPDEQAHGAVIAAITPEQPARVVTEAARYAKLHAAQLVVVHVDVTRFVTYEDPDGAPHTAPIDINVDAGIEELAEVKRHVAEALEGVDVEWSTTQLVGDPALAIKHFANKIDSPLIVIGTRKRGFGETMREFFTGSVAARLSHRQHRPLLVVPLGESIADDRPIFDEG